MCCCREKLCMPSSPPARSLAPPSFFSPLPLSLSPSLSRERKVMGAKKPQKRRTRMERRRRQLSATRDRPSEEKDGWICAPALSLSLSPLSLSLPSRPGPFRCPSLLHLLAHSPAAAEKRGNNFGALIDNPADIRRQIRRKVGGRLESHSCLASGTSSVTAPGSCVYSTVQ